MKTISVDALVKELLERELFYSEHKDDDFAQGIVIGLRKAIYIAKFICPDISKEREEKLEQLAE